MEEMEQQANIVMEQAITLITSYGLSVIGAIAILVIGVFLSRRAQSVLVKILKRSGHVDDMLSSFFGSLLRYLVLAITIIAVLNQFGVQTASLIAVLGAAGLAIGLALQGTLSNVAAGVMLLLFRPFKVGDYVEAGGQAGTVKGVSLFVTELASGARCRYHPAEAVARSLS